MKKLLLIVLIVTMVFSINTVVFAEHYVNGVEGIKAASVPPPGYYYRMYTAFYTADKLMDKNGDESPQNFEIDVIANVHRYIWVTKHKFFGGYFFMDAVIPLLYIDLKMIDEDQGGLGDINLEPFGLVWHRERYDAALGLSVYCPTGEYSTKDPMPPGKDMFTGMLTFGGTYYLDEAKTLSGSVLARYEVHSNQEHNDYTPGHDFHFEWGLGKNINGIVDVGMAGYCQWQVTDDRGSDSTDDKPHDQVYAAGPEINIFCPPVKMFFNLRSIWEFAAKDRPEGSISTLTITKIF